jgi:hypothetical protein
MNDLSWFLIFVDVYGNFRIFLEISTAIVFFYCLVKCVFSFMVLQDHLREEEEKQMQKWLYSKPKFVVLAFVILSQVVMPSKQTIYLVAGSELGEEVLMSEEGKKIKSLVRDQINRYATDIKISSE